LHADISKQTSGPKTSKDLSLHQAVGVHVAVSAAGIMAGILGAPQTPIGSCIGGSNGRAQMTDPLTIHLASMSRFQLFEIIHLMKVRNQLF
jgi:cleavage stimulation factor subunit 2